MKNVFYLSLFLSSLATFNTRAQVIRPDQKGPIEISSPNSNIKIIRNEQPGNKITVHINDTGDKAKTIDQTRPKRYIIKLRDHTTTNTPLSKAARIARVRNVKNQHQQFLQKLSTRVPTTPASARKRAVVYHEYIHTFNGFAIEMTEEFRIFVGSLPEVASISEDQVVRAVDLASSQIINADDVWDTFGATGAGVNIGIIDTGIDYTHPDLGSGFGNGFKVIGGYDFVNEDSDPMDDHSHGTHVAGIAAGNGPGLKGVAPDANLYAYKVLDNWGFGQDSWIIAAIERSVDPNEDGNTDDHLDVVNMSLGRAVGGDDPMSEAVNNAVLQGVVYCVAAGNSYEYFTVGTPAIAERAITVAATDFNDQTAWFSSKGPTLDYKIKPDVAAPGVSIYSSVLNGNYANYDGTSMATPHVAGAAALLLEKNPLWTPEVVKGALMGTAITSTENLWHQGAGRIDVLEAIQTEFIATPSSISIGLLNASNSSINTSSTITIQNISSSSRTFDLTAEGLAVGAGVEISFTENQFTIPANSSKNIEVSFTIDGPNLPTLASPENYSGVIRATSGAHDIMIPYAFLYSKTTNLKFTGTLPLNAFVIGTDPSSSYFESITPQPVTQLLLPDGEYDIIALYELSHYNVKEFTANQDDTVKLDLSESSNKIQFIPKGIDGQPLVISNNAMGSLGLFSPDRNFMSFTLGVSTEAFINDQDIFGFEFKLLTADPHDSSLYYDVSLATGLIINDSMTISNDPESFKKLTIKNPYQQIGHNQNLTTILRLAGGFSTFNTYPFKVPATLRVLANPHEPSAFFLGAKLALSTDEGNGWELPIYNFNNDKSLTFSRFWGDSIKTIREVEHFTYNLGHGLLKTNALISAYDTMVYYGSYSMNGRLLNSLEEVEKGLIEYDFYRNGILIKHDTSRNVGAFDYNTISAPIIDGNYTVKLHYKNFFFPEAFSTIDEVVTFSYPDLVQHDIIPKLELSSNLNITKDLIQGQNWKLEMNVAACEGCVYKTSSNDIYYRLNGSSQWELLATEITGDISYEAIIPDTLSTGSYDLRIVSTNNSATSRTMEIKPAFRVLVSNPPAKVALIDPADQSVTGRLPRFTWAAADKAVSYEIAVSEDTSFDRLIINEEVSDTTFQPGRLLKESTNYFWKVKARNEISENGPWSNHFTFKTNNQSWTPDLIAPLNADTLHSTHVKLIWSKVPEAPEYYLQIGSDPNFISYNEFVTTEEFMELDVAPFTHIYWRVRAKMSTKWSAEFSFIVLDNINLHYPTNNEINIPLHTTFRWESSFSGSFLIQIAEDSVFQNITHEVFTTATQTDISLQPDKLYFWRVLSGDQKIISEVFKFRTTDLQFDLFSPVNGKDSVSLSALFEWEYVTGVWSYDFIIANDENFENVVHQGSAGWGNYFYDGLDYSHTYFWKVIAHYSNVSVPSVTFSFTTLSRSADPNAITLITPMNYTMQTTPEVQFTWTNNNSSTYSLQISQDSTFFSNVTSLELTDTVVNIHDFEVGQMHYWRVKSTKSPRWTPAFQFKSFDPTITLVYPSNRAASVPLDTIFRWEPVLLAESYQIWISNDEDFVNIINTSNTLLPEVNITELAPSTVYFWKVGAEISGRLYWSETFSFSTVLLTPNEPTVTSESLTAVPNPSQGIVELRLTINDRSQATVKIVNALGQQTFFRDLGSVSGEQRVVWDTRGEQEKVSNGLYVATLQTSFGLYHIKIMIKR